MHAGSVSYAFYHRAQATLEPEPFFDEALGHLKLAADLRNIRDALGYDLI